MASHHDAFVLCAHLCIVFSPRSSCRCALRSNNNIVEPAACMLGSVCRPWCCAASPAHNHTPTPDAASLSVVCYMLAHRYCCHGTNLGSCRLSELAEPHWVLIETGPDQIHTQFRCLVIPRSCLSWQSPIDALRRRLRHHPGNSHPPQLPDSKRVPSVL